MGISQEKLQDLLADHSDIRDYFNKKSMGSENWIIDACHDFDEIVKELGGNKTLSNVAKTSAYPALGAGLGGFVGLLAGSLCSIMTTETWAPVLVFFIIGAGAGLTYGTMAEKQKPEVDDWRPAQTKAIQELKRRAAAYRA